MDAKTGNNSPSHRVHKITNRIQKTVQKTLRDYKTKQVETACNDPTGAEFYKIIKQLEPNLNKKARPIQNQNIENKSDAEEIAQKFEMIFGQNDVRPSVREQKELEDDLESLEHRIKTETEEHEKCTIRELKQALKKANMKSSKGPDGISNKLILIACQIDEFCEVVLDAINN